MQKEKKKNLIKIWIGILFIAGFFVTALKTNAANYPLEIVFPISAGSGTPAISSAHPIFRAYPGIEYNIRPHVQGGMYPFTFSLSNAPSGMTIDSDTGEISWPNPQANASNITLTVTDAESATAQSQWSITVSTSGYLFVNSSYSGAETGSLTQPFSSIQNLLDNTSAANVNDIVYFRSGNYTAPVFNPSYYLNYGLNTANRPSAWIGYPNEAVNIDMQDHYFELGWLYFDKLNFNNIPDWWGRASSAVNYAVIRRCTFNDAAAIYRTDNANQGLYYTSDLGSGYYLTFQDNIVHDFTDVQGFGSLYSQNKNLIEDNHFYNFYISVTNGRPIIAEKYNNIRTTIRHNRIESSHASFNPIGHGNNGLFHDSGDMEICFNRLKGVSTDATAIWFNNDGATDPQLTTYVYRNTIEGEFIISYLDGSSCGSSGPWDFRNNVIINPGLAYATLNFDHIAYRGGTNTPQNCPTQVDNLKGFAADNIVDSSGNLTSGYSQYLGTRGWQIGESDTVAPASPSGLSVN